MPSCNDSKDDRIVAPPVTIGQTVIDMTPAWSPDGSRIIYFRDSSKRLGQSWPWGVFLRDVATGKDSLIWPSFHAVDFTWSPDGKKVAYGYQGQIHVRNLENGVATRITSQYERCWCPRWSPCGGEIAYFIRAGSAGGLYLFSEIDSTSRFVLAGCTAGDYFVNCDQLAVIDPGYHPAVVTFEDASIRNLSSLASDEIAVSPLGSEVLVSSNPAMQIQVYSINR